MSAFIRDHDTAFTIGAGAHLTGDGKSEFLEYLKNNNWWKTRFFPNISTYENEYYGTKFSDWNSGRKLIDDLKFPTYSKTGFNDSSADYYVEIKEAFYTIHLFQLHNQEREGMDSEKTKALQWLVKGVDGIVKSDQDFIIICGRDLRNSLQTDIHPDNMQKLLAKVDLIISDDFEPFHYSVNEENPNGAVMINSGSISTNSKYSPPGFVQVFHLTNPSALVVLYLDADEDEFRFPSSGCSFVKYINGPTMPLSLRISEDTEKPERVICELPEEYTQSRMQMITEKLCRMIGECDRVWITPESGLKAGTVTYRDLWNVFPKNGEIYILDLTYTQLRKIFGKEMILDTNSNQKVAISSYFGDFIIERFQLPEERIIKTEQHEIELLENYLKTTFPMKEQ
jgi:hypothetical protein